MGIFWRKVARNSIDFHICRAELEAKYREMMADAERREQAALWKVERRKLDVARRQFLEAEKAEIRAEVR